MVIKYEKTNPAALAGHTDTLRSMIGIFRRAKIPVEYSQGFNPHMEIYFSPALACGIESQCEYLTVKAPFDENVTEKLNAVAQKGFRFIRAFDVSANLSALVTSAKYVVSGNGLGKRCDELTADEYVISYDEKGQVVTKDVASKIFSVEKIDDDSFFVTLACGNNNLRCDRLAAFLQNKYDPDGDYATTKCEMFVGEDTVDKYLSKLALNG